MRRMLYSRIIVEMRKTEVLYVCGVRWSWGPIPDPGGPGSGGQGAVSVPRRSPGGLQSCGSSSAVPGVEVGGGRACSSLSFQTSSCPSNQRWGSLTVCLDSPSLPYLTLPSQFALLLLSRSPYSYLVPISPYYCHMCNQNCCQFYIPGENMMYLLAPNNYVFSNFFFLLRCCNKYNY